MRSILAWSMIAAAGCGSGASRTGAGARGGESASAPERAPTSSAAADELEPMLLDETAGEIRISGEVPGDWSPVIRAAKADLVSCFGSFASSVHACRKRLGLQVDNTTTLRLDISRDEYSASGAISALPTSTSADTCADSYERADEVTSCIEEVLADNLVGSPAGSFRLFFRSGTSSLGGTGTIGRPRGN